MLESRRESGVYRVVCLWVCVNGGVCMLAGPEKRVAERRADSRCFWRGTAATATTEYRNRTQQKRRLLITVQARTAGGDPGYIPLRPFSCCLSVPCATETQKQLKSAAFTDSEMLIYQLDHIRKTEKFLPPKLKIQRKSYVFVFLFWSIQFHLFRTRKYIQKQNWNTVKTGTMSQFIVLSFSGRTFCHNIQQQYTYFNSMFVEVYT